MHEHQNRPVEQPRIGRFFCDWKITMNAAQMSTAIAKIVKRLLLYAKSSTPGRVASEIISCAKRSESQQTDAKNEAQAISSKKVDAENESSRLHPNAYTESENLAGDQLYTSHQSVRSALGLKAHSFILLKIFIYSFFILT
jgi:hypothetical protein